MKNFDRIETFLDQIHIFPLSWLSLSLVKRLLIVIFSYGLGTIGLCYFFPLAHNGSTMYLPIASACWLFRYRGLVVSLVLNGIVFQLAYLFLLRGILSDQAFMEGGVIGLGTSLGLGLIVCWLRVSVDLVQVARQRALTAGQERFQALKLERQVSLAYEQQRKINELKDHFLVNVSHELRTPLTMLGASLELLGEHRERLDEAMCIHLLEEAQASQAELVELVNRVLDATTMVSDLPQARCEVVKVHQLTREVLDLMPPEDIQSYTIHFQITEEVIVWADPQFLRQILRNLLSNIFKYVPTQTEICIEAVQADPSSPVYLCVQDDGPGIPVEEIPLLFEKFVRLKRDLAGTTRGLGLGLYICKCLVEAMKGRIWIESPVHLGEGCRFCVSLPPGSAR